MPVPSVPGPLAGISPVVGSAPPTWVGALDLRECLANLGVEGVEGVDVGGGPVAVVEHHP